MRKKDFDQKALERVERICRAAIKVFSKKGYLSANMDNISAAARISKGAIYHYFSRKHEILYFILDRYMDLVLENLEQDLLKIKSPSKRLCFIICRHIQLYASHSSEAKTLLHDANCLPLKSHNMIKEKERKYLEIVTDVLMEFFDGRKSIARSEVKAIAFILFGMCNWTYQWYDPRGALRPNELAELIWRVLLNGISEF